MVKVTKIEGADVSVVATNLQNNFNKAGYDVKINPVTSSSVNASGFRLNNDYVRKYGHNISPYTQRKGRILGWKNWVHVNNIFNSTLDKLSVSANIHSLAGKFRIREGKKRFTESDWENLADENVGSQIDPVARRDAWRPENPAVIKKLEEVI